MLKAKTCRSLFPTSRETQPARNKCWEVWKKPTKMSQIMEPGLLLSREYGQWHFLQLSSLQPNGLRKSLDRRSPTGWVRSVCGSAFCGPNPLPGQKEKIQTMPQLKKITNLFGFFCLYQGWFQISNTTDHVKLQSEQWVQKSILASKLLRGNDQLLFSRICGSELTWFKKFVLVVFVKTN